jgi:predicted hydrocarbon binding protein
MPATIAVAHGGISIPAASLHALRRALQGAGKDAGELLQSAGTAAGPTMLAAFGEWLHTERGVDHVGHLDQAHFNEALSAFFGHLGWGTLTVDSLGGGFLAIDSADWAEAEPGAGEWPTCHFSAGMLPAFLGQVSGHALASLETDCRSRGDSRCRFVVGAPENLKVLYGRITGGASLEDAVRG